MLTVFFWCIFSLYVQGAFLEGRTYAKKLEGIRLGFLFLGVVLAPSAWPGLEPDVVSLASIYGVASFGLCFLYEIFGREKSAVTATE